jgi:3-deoxy-D-manno-octulosonic-acid transferase
MVLAPRHPERFASVAELIGASHVKLWRRSQWKDEAIAGGIFLLDTIGELGALYQLADVAFVGGSLVPRGGHNILEPAYFGVPILVGPYTENFRNIIARFSEADAVRLVRDPVDLAANVLALIGNAEERDRLGRRATAVARENAGAAERTLEELNKLLTVPVRMNLPEPVPR